MKNYWFVILLFSSLIVGSCLSNNNKITGYWEVTFSDSIQNPTQFFYFKEYQKGLQLTIDEPDEDWYDIPGENIYFQNDSLYFERFWGLENYYGKFSQEDSTFSGFKVISNNLPISFKMQKVQSGKFAYKIPKTNIAGNIDSKYCYKKPIPLNDNFKCASLTDVGMDSLVIVRLIDNILTKKIPNIHSLLILKDNKLVLEEYFYNYTSNKRHRVHSVTKSFTSALVGIALDEGLISGVEEPVWKYFSDRNSTKWVNEKYNIQIQHLLSMSAGLNWKGLIPGESNDDMDMYKTDDYFGFLLNKELKFTPGANFCYNNGLSLMLGHILEESSGMSVDSFAKEKLFKQLKINNYSWDIDKKGITRTDGGLKLRPRDMLKFGQFYINNGKWNDEQIISENWIHTSTEHKISSNNQNYAFNWWLKNYTINNKVIRTIYALGHGEQAIILVPEQNLVFVMTAGNYFQVEHRPFEILSDYILPSIQNRHI